MSLLIAPAKLTVSEDFRQLFREACNAYVISYENEVASLTKRDFSESEEMAQRHHTTLAVLSAAAAAFDDEAAFRLLDKDLTIHGPPMLHPSILGPGFAPDHRYEPENRSSSWSIHIPYTAVAIAFNARDCLAYMKERNQVDLDATFCELRLVKSPVVDDQVRRLNAIEAFELDINGLDAGLFVDVARALLINPLADKKQVHLTIAGICTKAISDGNVAIQDACIEIGIQALHPRSLAETAISSSNFAFLERMRSHIPWETTGSNRHLLEIMAKQRWEAKDTFKDQCFMKMLDWVAEDGRLSELFAYRRVPGKAEEGFSVADHLANAGMGAPLLKMFDMGLDPHDANGHGSSVVDRLEAAVAGANSGPRSKAQAQALQMCRSWLAKQAAMEALGEIGALPSASL